MHNFIVFIYYKSISTTRKRQHSNSTPRTSNSQIRDDIISNPNRLAAFNTSLSIPLLVGSGLTLGLNRSLNMLPQQTVDLFSQQDPLNASIDNDDLQGLSKKRKREDGKNDMLAKRSLFQETVDESEPSSSVKQEPAIDNDDKKKKSRKSVTEWTEKEVSPYCCNSI